MYDGAGDGNRTHASSLGSYSSTIELHPRYAQCLNRRGEYTGGILDSEVSSDLTTGFCGRFI